MPTKKSRKSPRISRRIALSFGRKLPALTANVSLRGFEAELPQLFVPGGDVDGFLLLGETEAPFKGRVVWAQAGNPQLSTWSRVGVEFTEVPAGLAGYLTAPRD